MILLLLLSCFSYGIENSRDFDFDQDLDQFMNKALEENNVAGAIVVVVKDGEILLEKGYGYSDITSSKKVDPLVDQFQIASVTKLFTATAALQLVEQAKIDLNTDINTYLKTYQVENEFSSDLTLYHLLTNTGGFGENVIGIYYDELFDDIIPLDNTIKETMPKMVRNPGEVIQYSNHGFALAGYLVENISGIQFNEYVENNIFAPLGMTNSSYYLNKSNKDVISKGYSYSSDGFVEKQLGTIAVHPAGSITSSANDMGKFLLAHMNDGELNGNRILSEELSKEMKTQQFAQNSILSGYGLGFFQNYKNSDIYMHDGDTDSFTSQLSLHPEKEIGYFISYNTMDDGVLRDQFEEFFYGYHDIPLFQNNYKAESFTPNTDDLSEFSGDYVFVQRITDGVLKIRGLFLKMTVKFDSDNNLVFKVFDSKMGGTYEHYEDNIFIKKENNKKVLLKTGSDGQKYIVIDMKVPMQTLEKLDTKDYIFENYVRNYVFIMPFIGILLWIISLFRKNKVKHEGATKHVKKLSKGINILIFIIMVLIIVVMFTQSDSFRVMIVLITNIVSGLITGISLLLFLKIRTATKKKVISIWQVSYTTLVLLAGIGAVIYVSYLDILFI
jgi:CubicO group peptidase (beta-lactamase class C family)